MQLIHVYSETRSRWLLSCSSEVAMLEQVILSWRAWDNGGFQAAPAAVTFSQKNGKGFLRDHGMPLFAWITLKFLNAPNGIQ